MLADIEAATSDVHILIFGFKAGEIGNRFRDLLVKKVGKASASGSSRKRRSASPASASKAFYDSMVAGGVQVVANQGAFLDLDGLLGERRIDWRFDDFLHFDHRKVIVDRRPGRLRRRARHRGPLRHRDPRPDAPPRGPDRRPAPGRVPALVALPGRAAPGERRGPRPVLPARVAGGRGRHGRVEMGSS